MTYTFGPHRGTYGRFIRQPSHTITRGVVEVFIGLDAITIRDADGLILYIHRPKHVCLKMDDSLDIFSDNTEEPSN